MNSKYFLSALIFIGLYSCVGSPIDENSSKYYRKSWGTVYFTDKSAGTTGIGNKIKGADAKTFLPLAEFVAKDKKMVYYKDIPQPHIDRESFQVKEDGTMRDKDHVYFPSLEDKNYTLRILYNVDLETYGSYKGHFGWGYDKNHVYQSYSKPVEADPASFMFLSNNFMKDKDFLYTSYFGNMKKLQLKTDSLVSLGETYVRDNDRVYYFDLKKTNEFQSIPFHSVENMTIPTDPFIIIDGKIYDNGHLLNEGDADAATFRILDGYFSRDTSHIFYSGKAIPADAKSFELLQEGFAKDQQSAYFLGHLLQNVDVKSFKIVNSLYFSDKNHVYFIHSIPRGKGDFFVIVDGADPETFYHDPGKDELYGADDKNEFYNGGLIIKPV
ncbi:MAG: DKNYY domain-containing protein [Dysgonamonadaceae bacterium]|jgi:hypothetical protein|nr:DKNYY domain-containing protein [Dysgonamonadaceae bacterium]